MAFEFPQFSRKMYPQFRNHFRKEQVHCIIKVQASRFKMRAKRTIFSLYDLLLQSYISL